RGETQAVDVLGPGDLVHVPEREGRVDRRAGVDRAGRLALRAAIVLVAVELRRDLVAAAAAERCQRPDAGGGHVEGDGLGDRVAAIDARALVDRLGVQLGRPRGRARLQATRQRQVEPGGGAVGPGADEAAVLIAGCRVLRCGLILVDRGRRPGLAQAPLPGFLVDVGEPAVVRFLAGEHVAVRPIAGPLAIDRP